MKGDDIMSEKTYLNIETGEYMTAEQIARGAMLEKHINMQRFDWLKLYYKKLPVVGKVVNSAKLDIIIYLLLNMSPSEFTYVGTYAEISKATGASKITVLKTIELLQQNDLIRQIKRSYWMVNPRIVINGNSAKEYALIQRYNKLQPPVTNETADSSNVILD